jgi:hypothetical protein
MICDLIINLLNYNRLLPITSIINSMARRISTIRLQAAFEKNG